MKRSWAMAAALAAAIPALASAGTTTMTFQVSVTVSASCAMQSRAWSEPATGDGPATLEKAFGVSCSSLTPHALTLERLPAFPAVETQADAGMVVVSLTF